MDVLPLVPVGSLVLVVAWLIWPVLQDSLNTSASRFDADGDAEDLAKDLFDTWAAHGDQPGLVSRKRAA